LEGIWDFEISLPSLLSDYFETIWGDIVELLARTGLIDGAGDLVPWQDLLTSS
jgi:hypothetical protein